MPIDGVISNRLAVAKESKVQLILPARRRLGDRGGNRRCGHSRAGRALSNIPSYDALVSATRMRRSSPRPVSKSRCSSRHHKSRNLRQQAGNAVSYGMTWDQALRAVTLSPRRSSASRIATARSNPQGGQRRRLVGRPVRVHDGRGARADSGEGDPLTSRQTELFERYKKLPLRTRAAEAHQAARAAKTSGVLPPLANCSIEPPSQNTRVIA